MTYQDITLAATKLAEQIRDLLMKYVSPLTLSVEEAQELPEVKAEIARLEAEFKQVLKEYLDEEK